MDQRPRVRPTAPSWDEPDALGAWSWVVATALAVLCASLAVVATLLAAWAFSMAYLLTANDPQSPESAGDIARQGILLGVPQVMILAVSWPAGRAHGAAPAYGSRSHDARRSRHHRPRGVAAPSRAPHERIAQPGGARHGLRRCRGPGAGARPVLPPAQAAVTDVSGGRRTTCG